MKNQLFKNEHQVKLFHEIKKTLPDKNALPYQVSDLLGVGLDAAYRRIRGEKPISFEEAIILCQNFQISMETLTNVVIGESFIRCRYSPLNLEDINNYLNLFQAISDNIEHAKLAPDCEILLSALTIPPFNILSYKDLNFFIIFSWSKSVYDFADSFEVFANKFDSLETFEKCCAKIVRNYLSVPSTDIWTNNTTDSILKLINYHYEMRHFKEKKTPLFLCEQMLDLMNTLQKWSEKGKKGKQETPFNFFISETDIGNTYILLKNSKRTSCMVKLYTINALIISDERFCQETESWLRNTARRATLISGASEVVRFQFFDAQFLKIRRLMEKIQSGI